MFQTIYRAFLYYRLSKEDDLEVSRKNSAQKIKDESNSITNQRGLSHNFLQNHRDILLVDEFSDDGYTGLDYERPGFQKMMAQIKKEKINCLIVKDFSRLGRDYLENCRYIERIFPQMGIRFISINDGYDSAAERMPSDHIIVPFKNLMNETYSRDTSVKIRSHMLVKREEGDFIAPFAVYGYKKDRENTNLLIPDPYASKVVAEIFCMKIKGMSQKGIADHLNDQGILPPLEYKAYTGSRFRTSFKRKDKPEWSENMIARILSNRVYTGVVEQGKVKKVNYKTNRRKSVPRKEWIVCNDKHQPVVDKFVFDIVQHLLETDTRVAPGREVLYPFSGLLYCADCKMPMIRKRDKQGAKEYIYYICSSWKNNGGCSSHRINEKVLNEAVLATLQMYMNVILDLEQALSKLNCDQISKYKMEQIQQESELVHESEKRVKQSARGLYEDFKGGILNEEEYREFQTLYRTEERNLKTKAKSLQKKLDSFALNAKTQISRINWFKQHGGIAELDRAILALLIRDIKISDGHSLTITFNCRDEFEDSIKRIKGEVGEHGKKE